MKVRRLILVLIIGVIVIVTILALTLQDYLEDDIEVVINECTITQEAQIEQPTLYPITCMSNRFLNIETSVYINRSGDIILSNDDWLYNGLFDENELAIVTNEDYNSGIINKQGEYLIEPDYFHINYIGNQMYFLQTNDDLNYLAEYQNGEFILSEITYDWVYRYSEGLAAVKTTNDKIGFINLEGDLIINAVYDYNSALTYQVKDGKVILIYNDLYGVITKNNEVVINFLYDRIEKRDERSHYLRFQQGDLWGIMDDDFNIVIEPTYQNINAITDNLAAVSKDSIHYAFLNLDNKYLVTNYDYYAMDPFQFVTSFNYFRHNYAVVSLDGETYNAIDRSFEPLLEEGVRGIKIIDEEHLLLYREENVYEIFNVLTGKGILLEHEDVEVYPAFGIVAVSVESTFDGSTLFKLLDINGEELFPDLIIYNNMDLRVIDGEELLFFDGEYDGLVFSSYLDHELNLLWQPVTKSELNKSMD